MLRENTTRTRRNREARSITAKSHTSELCRKDKRFVLQQPPNHASQGSLKKPGYISLLKTPLIDELESLSEALDYDSETGLFRWMQDTRKIVAGSLAGSTNKDGHLVIGHKGKIYQASHLAWYFQTAEWPEWPIYYTDNNPLNLAFGNLYRHSYLRKSKAAYMRRYREYKKHLGKLAREKRAGVSDVPHVSPAKQDGKTIWNVRSSWDPRVILVSFHTKDEAENYARLALAGREFLFHNPPATFGDPFVANTKAGGSAALTLQQATDLFAYDPQTGAIYKRTPELRAGVPAIYLDDNRRPVVRTRSRTYTAGMMAWFLHTGDWPKRKQLSYRDGNRKNTIFANLYLKDTLSDE